MSQAGSNQVWLSVCSYLCSRLNDLLPVNHMPCSLQFSFWSERSFYCNCIWIRWQKVAWVIHALTCKGYSSESLVDHNEDWFGNGLIWNRVVRKMMLQCCQCPVTIRRKVSYRSLWPDSWQLSSVLPGAAWKPVWCISFDWNDISFHVIIMCQQLISQDLGAYDINWLLDFFQ